MRIEWKINNQDIQTIQDFVEKQKNNPFVQDRFKRNVENIDHNITKENIWRVLTGCLLTTQQRSGPNSSITRFLQSKPFLLSYKACVNIKDLEEFIYRTLSDFGGIRRTNTISKELHYNFTILENSLWKILLTKLNQLLNNTMPDLEKEIADFIADNFHGFGPKQSRNFLQWLGLTKYEIPIDSRITKWLNSFGFPIVLNASALGDKHYYQFISDGIKQLCLASDIYPCILDAAIFSSFDGNNWTNDNIVY